MNKLFLFILTISSFRLSASAPGYHYILFLYPKEIPQDKELNGSSFLSEKSVLRREKLNIELSPRDFPISESIVQSIAQNAYLQVIHRSKWLNAIEVNVQSRSDSFKLKAIPSVKSIRYMGHMKNEPIPVPQKPEAIYYSGAENLMSLKANFNTSEFTEEAYGYSYHHNQMADIPFLHRKGFTGANIQIAVFDGGFKNAYQAKGMEDLLSPSTFIHDFVDEDGSVWEDDRHGANVLGFMKTFDPGSYIGSAPFARYHLFRTEITSQELPLEEFYWVLAAELADSLGVDMIIGSVGYHTFDEEELNHQFSEMNGRYNIASIAANYARSIGLPVICSAGNEGNKKWRRIGTPADALGSLCIASCNSIGEISGFSSRGPSYDKRVKPDFTMMGESIQVHSIGGHYRGNGTSYSTPTFAGGLACLLQYGTHIKPDTIISKLRLTSTHSRSPDSLYGYGIPNFGLALYFLGYGGSTRVSEFQYPLKVTQFKDLIVNIYSDTVQTIQVEMKKISSGKSKIIYTYEVNLSEGQWYQNYDMMDMPKRKWRKKAKLKSKESLQLTITTQKNTYSIQATAAP